MSRRPRRKRTARSAPGSGGLRLALLLTGTVLAAYAGVLAAKWANVPTPSRADVEPVALFAAGAAGLALILRLTRLRVDARLLGAALFLCGIGVAADFRFHMYSGTAASAATAYTGLLGMLLCAVVALIGRDTAGRRLFHAAAPLCYLAALGVLAAMVVWGRRYRGGVFLPGGINPTEIVKVLLVLALAPWMANQRKALSLTLLGWPLPPPAVALTLAALWALPMLALAYLRDIGMLVLCSGVIVAMLFAATGRLGYLVGGLLLAGGITWGGYYLTPHIATRVIAWATPFRDPTGSGWQTLQGLSAMYTGGFWGIGFGAGSPRLIPVASTDFIYAVLGEELGFCGCVLVVGALLALLRAACDITERQSDETDRLLGAGLTALIALQSLLNIGGVIKAIPVTGVPLPFVSRGGSSLVTSFLALGLLLALSASPPAGKRKK